MKFIEIGRTGRPHGTRGELGLSVDERYYDDLLAAKFLLIGTPPIPYPVASFTTGGKLRVQLENFDRREAVSLLSNKLLALPADQLAAREEEAETPWDELIGYRVEAEGYPVLGPIAAIVDLPEHYLAEMTHEGREIYLPLHEDLVIGIREEDRTLVMDLPLGLLEL